MASTPQPEEKPGIDIPDLRRAVAFLRNSTAECPAAVLQVLGISGPASGPFSTRARLLARLRASTQHDDVKFLDAILSEAPYKAVASGWGISMRHFFRKRDELLGRIAAMLNSPGAAAEVFDRESDGRRRLDMAARLLVSGFPERSFRVATELLEEGAPESLRAGASGVLAKAAFDCGRGERANDELRTLRSRRDSPDSAIEAFFAEAFVEYRNGYFGRALQLAERGAAIAQERLIRTPAAVRTVVARLHFLGILHHEGGSCKRSVEAFLAARNLLLTLADPPRRELAENLAFCAVSRVSLPGQLPLALQESREAIELASRHGLDRENVWAHIAFSMVTKAASRTGESIESCRTALLIARECLAGDELCRILTVNTRLETAAGNIQGAMTLVPEVRALGERLAPFMSGITMLCEAKAHEVAGDGESAKLSATSAIEKLESRSTSHYIGLAYTTRAATLSARSRRKAAQDIEMAVGYLRNGAATYDLARALDLSAAITGNKLHLQEATDLRAVASL